MSEIADRMERAIAAIRTRDTTTARRLLSRIVLDAPRHADAWYLLSFLVEKSEQQTDCLQLALKYAPNHDAARTRLEKKTSVDVPRKPTAPVSRQDEFAPLYADPTPVDALGLRRRARNTLVRGEIRTVGQLSSLSSESLLQIRGMGEATLAEIDSCLRHYQTAYAPAVNVVTEAQENRDAENDSGQMEHLSGSEAVPLSVLGLSRRTHNALMRADVRFLHQLLPLSEKDLLGLKNSGPKTVEEIKTRLNIFLELNHINTQMPDNPPEIAQATTDSQAIAFSPLLVARLADIPLHGISIRRIGLNESTIGWLEQRGTTTIKELLQHSEKITRESEIGQLLTEYLEWIVDQDSSVWSDEIYGNGVIPFSKLRLANSSCEKYITEWLGLLNARERKVLFWRYGISDGTSLTLQEIGGKLDNISRERVRQLQKRGLQTLKRLYNGQGQRSLKPVLDYLEHAFREQGGLLSEGELESRFREDSLVTVGNVNLVGFLDLMSEIDDRILYFKKQRFFALSAYSKDLITRIQSKMGDLMREQKTPLSQEALLAKFRGTDLYREIQGGSPDGFLLACLRVHPKAKQIEPGLFGCDSPSIKRLGAIVTALREIGEPSHYTVITQRTNAFLSPNEQFTERALHAKLGQHPDIFVWTRLRGTYGLKEWGLEHGLSYVDAIEEILLEAGRPLSFEQVIERISAHREHFDEGSVAITLSTHTKFKSLVNRTYGLSSWNNEISGLDFADMFGEQLAQHQAELDRLNNNAKLDTQSEVDKIRRMGLDFFAP